jgi:hypothetical protein
MKQKLLAKRRLRRLWLRHHTPEVKRQLNKASRELKQLFSENFNTSFQQYLQNLSPTASTDYSLWKAIKKIKHIPTSSPPLLTAQGTWARNNATKAQAFANHLKSVFQPHPTNNALAMEGILTRLLESSYQLELPPFRFKRSEIQNVIMNLSPKSCPGYNLITGKILQELLPAGIKYITQLSMLHFSSSTSLTNEK